MIFGGTTDQAEGRHPYQEKEPLEAWPNDVNPHTGEIGLLLLQEVQSQPFLIMWQYYFFLSGGPRGPEPTRYGDWERKGRCTDF